MQYKPVMVIKAIVCLVLGIPILFVPQFFYSLFGAEIGISGSFPAQEYGAAVLGVMLLAWFARNAEPSDTRRAIILGLFAYDAIGFVITLMAIFAGILNAMGWLAVIIYLFFTIGFGSLLATKTSNKSTALAS